MPHIALLSLFLVFSSYAAEYWYPVGCSKNSKSFYIHQISSDNIELWSFDRATKTLHKELPSYLNPAGFTLLPNNKGFSFIDNGIIRVKEFNKRSSRSLEVFEPIYDINSINWKDSDTCYFHAKYRDHYGIFQLTQQGQLDCIIKQEGVDYIYPQLVGESLFYIKREICDDGLLNYKVMVMTYPTIKTLTKKDLIEQLVMEQDQLIEHANLEKQAVIYDFKEQAIGYLKMTSKKDGFLVAYSTTFLRNKSDFKCTYYCLKFDHNKWTISLHKLLVIPAQLLFDQDQCLYEGIRPFLFVTDKLE